jgi:transposase InsO family protein
MTNSCTHVVSRDDGQHENYNLHRRHSACGMLSPIDYELAQTRTQAA